MGRRIRTIIATMLVLISVASCVDLSTNDPRAFPVPDTAEAYGTVLSGRTIKTDGWGHGSQIEYHAPNGRAYLWYPGNYRAVPSEWKVVPVGVSGKKSRTCYKYPSRSYNPLTRKNGGRWECRRSEEHTRWMTAIIEGDPFNLETGRIPARMERGKVLSMKEVLALTPSRENISYFWRK